MPKGDVATLGEAAQPDFSSKLPPFQKAAQLHLCQQHPTHEINQPVRPYCLCFHKTNTHRIMSRASQKTKSRTKSGVNGGSFPLCFAKILFSFRDR